MHSSIGSAEGVQNKKSIFADFVRSTSRERMPRSDVETNTQLTRKHLLLPVTEKRFNNIGPIQARGGSSLAKGVCPTP